MSQGLRRLKTLQNQVQPQKITSKLQNLHSKGWGYKDSKFQLNPQGLVTLTGSRYLFSGFVLPGLRQWAEATCGLDLNSQSADGQINVNPSVINQGFVNDLKEILQVEQLVFDDQERLFRSHGQDLEGIFQIRFQGGLQRVVDAVIYPRSTKQLSQVVQLACKHNVVLIPYGGGTNVTHALKLSSNEQRMIISVDMQLMNRIKHIDTTNMTALVQAGIIGIELEKELNKYGVCCGHEPDSVEMSSLGGWIATRASGMKKNRYGNIEDIVISITIVTARGTFTTQIGEAPRSSIGPDLKNLILGSEGNFGIITEALLKIKRVPEVKAFGSIVFPTFETGCNFLLDVSRSGQIPASIRLVDNNQFKFGMALKPPEKSAFKQYLSHFVKFYITEIKKFDPDKITLVTIVYEGQKKEVQQQQSAINQIRKRYKGISAGAENGIRGYFLTFMIAYLRDFGLTYNFIAESMETSVPWNKVQNLVALTQKRIIDACAQYGVSRKPFVSTRISQVYDNGCTVYIYFGFLTKGIKDPVHVYTEIEEQARDEVLKNGGSLSHHHGVGKIRKNMMDRAVGNLGIDIIKQIKQDFDPNNIFACNNLV